MEYQLRHKPQKKITHGEDTPLGATLKSDGVNFALFSEHATEVFLLLFDKAENDPTDVIKIEHRTGKVWHTFVHGISSGQLYAYKIHGAYDPAHGMRFNPHKLVIDPYAKAISSKFNNIDNLLFAYDLDAEKKDLSMDARDNMPICPKSVVIDDAFDWQGDKPPNISFEKLIIYEIHVKGFTAHPSSNVKYPGTYLGVKEKVPYLKDLGINAVELLPIHEFYVRDNLIDKGLTDYWGYNTIGFFAPESSYCTKQHFECPAKEFKTMVRELHKEGIEIILDVVFNHTGEGNELGPTLCFKGIDNCTYYALEGSSDQPFRYYLNATGTGNTLNAENPHVLTLVIDSLRYWVEVMHVDGFRFDLASILARIKGEFSATAAIFTAIEKDPVLSKMKLIAEPWDPTMDQVGNFPAGWAEWNGKFRDTMRKCLKGDLGQIQDLARRVTGSADLYGDDGRSPYHSINFITCHDGFTLKDLFSYNQKHNEANHEENKDGTDNNNSWNCGVEGETQDSNIIKLRKHLIKNAFCCLLFSLGTPMILGGDEFMRTQLGNNNAYCQDNDISWFNWDYMKTNADIYEFCKKAIAFRKRYSVLQRRKFVSGKDGDADTIPDITWYGENLEPPKWEDPEQSFLCFQLDGGEVPSKIGNYYLFFILNLGVTSYKIKIPQHKGMRWHRVVDTSLSGGEDFLQKGREIALNPSHSYQSKPRSIVMLLNKV